MFLNVVKHSEFFFSFTSSLANDMKKGVSVGDAWTHFCKAASPKDKPLKLAEVPLGWDEIKSTAPGNDINIP